MRNNVFFRRPLSFLLCLCLPAALPAQVETGTDDNAQLPYWQWQSEGMSIRWIQRLPDQTRAFFSARQFRAEDAERIAQRCVFQTIYKNTAPATADTVITYDLADWRILPRGKDASQGIYSKEAWLALWQQRQVPAAARIAFEWSLLPSRHRLLAGDYNWGMITFGLKPGARFDLHIVWQKDGETKTATIPAMQCALDVHPQPASSE
ncbi:MAG TPA: hypothetical protein ENI97_11935 [Gammaproteobacteria bacterium]|nr:hypothetical protein [Gammaproteobacteria bacterium]